VSGRSFSEDSLSDTPYPNADSRRSEKCFQGLPLHYVPLLVAIAPASLPLVEWSFWSQFFQGRLEEAFPMLGNLFFKPFSSNKTDLVLVEALRYILFLSGKFVISGSGYSHPSGGHSFDKRTI